MIDGLEKLKEGITPIQMMSDFDIRNIASLAVNDSEWVWILSSACFEGAGWGAYCIERETMVRITEDLDIVVMKMDMMGDTREFKPALNQAEIFKYLVRRKFMKV